MRTTIQCTIRGDKAWRRALVGSESMLVSAVGLELERQADAAIAYIGNNQASLFTNPTGNLRDNLFREEHKARGTRVSVRAGWMLGGWYGRVLEYGPRDKGPKKILPGKSLSTTSGLPTVALRWVSKGTGAVNYRRSSTYVWKDSMKRPHWKKAVDATRGRRNASLRRSVVAAISKAMR